MPTTIASFYTLEGDDNKEHKLGIVNMINSNIDEWTKALGKAPAFYIVEANDAFAEDYAKEANIKYKDYVDNVKNLYAKAYSIIAQPGINSYELHSFTTTLCITFIKTKMLKATSRQCNSLFEKMGTAAQPSDLVRQLKTFTMQQQRV